MANFNMPGMGTYGSSWQAHGYSGNGNVASLIDSAKGQAAIIVGSAHSCFLDLDEIRPAFPTALIFAVNDVGMFLPHVDHWCSLHAPNLETWRWVRYIHPKHETKISFHSYNIRPKLLDENPNWFDWDKLNPLFALSGYFAMQIAWIMGCAPIILTGCPGSPCRRFFEGHGINYSPHGEPGIRNQVISEMNRLPEFRHVVRSMSGWTREFFNDRQGRATWQLLAR